MGIFPNKFGIIIATVFLLIAFLICSGSTTNLFSNTPTKCGTNPNWYIGATVVEKVRVGVIISPPFFNFNELSANKFADEPDYKKLKFYLLRNMLDINSIPSNQYDWNIGIR